WRKVLFAQIQPVIEMLKSRHIQHNDSKDCHGQQPGQMFQQQSSEGSTHTRLRRQSASSVTATTMTAPTRVRCQTVGICRNSQAGGKATRKRQPNTTPRTVPRPPVMATPPTTAAAIACKVVSS